VYSLFHLYYEYLPEACPRRILRHFLSRECELDYKINNFHRISHIWRKKVLSPAVPPLPQHFKQDGKAPFSLFGTNPAPGRRL
jgi:hypothetical protein